jgi:NAD-dependent deacetylase sirtuin 5
LGNINFPNEKLTKGSIVHVEQNNFDDPFHPVLDITSPEDTRLAASSRTVEARIAYANPNINTTTINPADLPRCPSCKTGILRPGVVWFGEPLPEATLQEIDDWIDGGKVDLIMVIGTTARVYPAAGYVSQARARGARVAVINMDVEDLGATESLRPGDFLFEGDAAKILPEILKPVIGELGW